MRFGRETPTLRASHTPSAREAEDLACPFRPSNLASDARARENARIRARARENARIRRVRAVASASSRPRRPARREYVVAILKSNAYRVCTHNRGVVRGEPILVGLNEVRRIEHFDGYGPGEST
jgi:hypothetical protein